MRLARVILGIALFAVCGASANANCQVVQPVVTTAIVAPTVITTVVPVVVPATVFQFLPAVTPAVATPVPVPVQASVPVDPGMPLAAMPAAMPTCSNESIDRLVEQRVNERLRKMGITPPVSGEFPVAADPDGKPGATPYAPRANTPAPPAASAPAASDVISILDNRCAKCHTGANSKGKFVLFTQARQLANLSPEQKAFAYLKSRRALMPPDAKGDPKSPHAVSDAELDKLEDWAAQ